MEHFLKRNVLFRLTLKAKNLLLYLDDWALEIRSKKTVGYEHLQCLIIMARNIFSRSIGPFLTHQSLGIYNNFSWKPCNQHLFLRHLYCFFSFQSPIIYFIVSVNIYRQTEVFDLALALCLEADTNNKSVESFLKHSHRIKYNISYTSHLWVNNVLLTS